jgi:RNA polymerase sigma-70 factor (ECF subfamily)
MALVRLAVLSGHHTRVDLVRSNIPADENWSLACIISGVMSIPTMAGEEGELIRKILGGRRDLFGDLIAPHLKPLLHTLKATIGGNAEIEDILQQTVLKAFTHLEQFRFEASFRTWLIRIALNEARQSQRKWASSRLLAVDPTTLTLLPVKDERLSPWVEYQRTEARVQLRAALTLLPEKYRIIMLLRDLHGFTISEVARQLGLTIAAVKTRHLRARRKMAKFLSRPKPIAAAEFR